MTGKLLVFVTEDGEDVPCSGSGFMPGRCALLAMWSSGPTNRRDSIRNASVPGKRKACSYMANDENRSLNLLSNIISDKIATGPR